MAIEEGENGLQLTELLDIDTERIDLVSAPAVPSARRFLLFKHQEKEEDSMATTFVEDWDAALEKLEKGSDNKEVKKEIKVLFADLKKAVEDGAKLDTDAIDERVKKLDALLEGETVTKEDLEAYRDQLKELGESAKGPEGEEEKEEKEEKEEPEGEPSPTVKSVLEALPEDQREEYKKFLAGQQEAVKKAEQEKIDRIEKAEAEAKTAKEEVVKMQVKIRKAEYIEKAKRRFSHLAFKTEHWADLMFAMEDMKKDAREKLIGILEAADETIKKSKFYDEIGSSIPSEDSPEGRMEALAKEKAAKDGISMDIARGEIWKENPKLLAEQQKAKAGGK